MKNVSFEPGAERVYVVDEIENTHFEVRTPRSIDPQTVPAEAFRFPVDGGVTFETDAIEVPQFVSLYVWDRETEELVRTVDPQENATLAPGRYEIDLTNTPMKVFLSVDGSVDVTYTESETRLTFDDHRRIHLGARSLHEQPAGTVVTTADPHDLMQAISTFGSSLKTLSPDRAYPTLRGHPPEVVLGETLQIPTQFGPPESGVEIGVRPTVDDVFTVATLAHYLGATVVPADDGVAYVEADGVRKSFDQGDGFEQGVRDMLERQFVFDCVLRTEGIYGLDVKERDVFDTAVDRDVEALFDAPIAERIATCFDLPSAALDRPSQWHLLADVGSDPEDVELLPFYVTDLAHIRPEPERRRKQQVADKPPEIEDFFRSRRQSSGEFQSAQNGDFTVEEVVTPPSTEALTQFWSSEYFPIGAAKATPESLRRRFDDERQDISHVEVTVVCNEENMREESDAMYGFRDHVNLNVEVHYDLTTDELRKVLGESTDFFHYIGHVDESGMRCADGAVDLKGIDSVGVRAFFLNACQSYEQGLALLDAGAHGGIVTVAEVYDAIATKFGRRIARLMDAGFDLLSALNIGKDGTLAGGSYAIVGDGRYQLCRSMDGIPVMYNINRSEGSDEQFHVDIECYPTRTYGMGTLGVHHVGGTSDRQLLCGESDRGKLSKRSLKSLLSESGNPLQLDGELLWSGELAFDDL